MNETTLRSRKNYFFFGCCTKYRLAFEPFPLNFLICSFFSPSYIAFPIALPFGLFPIDFRSCLNNSRIKNDCYDCYSCYNNNTVCQKHFIFFGHFFFFELFLVPGLGPGIFLPRFAFAFFVSIPMTSPALPLVFFQRLSFCVSDG